MHPLELAVRLMQTGQFAQAQEVLEVFLHGNPGAGRAYWLLGAVRLNRGNPVGAEQAARTAIGLTGGTASLMVLLGEALNQQMRTGEAEAAFRQALALESGNTPAATNLAKVLIVRNRAREAVELLEDFINKVNPTPDLLLLRAQALLATGEYQRAIRAFQQTVAAAPGNGPARIGLAAALADDGQHTAAEDAARQAMARGYDSAQTRFVLARTLVSQRRYEEGESEFREAIRLRPDYLQAHVNLAETLWIRTGDARTVITEIDASLRVVPSLVPLRILKAKVLESSGDPRSALAELDFALTQNRNNPALHIAASQMAIKIDASKALEHAGRALQSMPEDPLALGTYGNALLASGHAAQAEAIAAKLFAANPLDGLAITIRATAWRMLGNPRYRDLYDYGRFIRQEIIDTPNGWPSLQAYLGDLAHGLVKLHASRAHPIRQSLRNGTQTDLAVGQDDDPAIRAFAQAIDGPIRRYMEALGEGSDPLRSRNTGHYKLSGIWSVRLHPNGFHFNHVHPAGWLSSACYIQLPSAVTMAGGEGWLQFGAPAYPTEPPTPPEYFVRPEPGLLVLFPSWLWHGTVPFSGSAEDSRLTIAFDVLPT